MPRSLVQGALSAKGERRQPCHSPVALPGTGFPRRYRFLWPVALLLLAAGGCSTAPKQQGSAVHTRHTTHTISPAPPKAKPPEFIFPREPKSRYGNPVSYVINGKRYYTLPSSRNYQEQGIASWYGAEFDGRLTSSREPYDMYALTAAHRTLPLPTYVEVKNLENGRTVVLRVNDRGPFHEERLLDLSFMAASRLGILEKGTGRVEVRALTSPEPSPYQASRNGTPRGNLYLQAGAFSQRANAEQLRKQLRSVTDTAVEINEVQRGDQVVYRVRLGPLPPDEPPYQLLTTLNSVGFKDPKIVAE